MDDRSSAYRYLIVVAALVVVVAGMRAAKSLIVPFLLAAFLAIVLTPVLHWLTRRRVPTFLALVAIIAVVSLCGLGVGVLFGRSVHDFTGKLPIYRATLDERAAALQNWLDERGIPPIPGLAPVDKPDDEEPNESDPTSDEDSQNDDARNVDPDGADPDGENPGGENSEGENPDAESPDGEEPDREEADGVEADGGRDDTATEPFDARQPGDTPPNALDPKLALQMVRTVLGELGSLFSNAVVIFITILFMLLEAARFPAKLQAAMGSGSPSLEQVADVVGNVRRYMAIKSATSALTGVLVAIFLTFLRVDYALLWGLLAFLFNFIPNIGSIMAAVPPVVLALVQPDGLAVAAYTAIGFVAINCFISYAIEPRYMGQGLGLSTLVVFVSLVFWGWVLGPVGMLLSAPLTMIVKITLAEFDDTRWIAVLMGSRAPEE